MFEQMPRFANHTEIEHSDVIRHVRDTIQASGENCTLEKARSVFDSLRRNDCGILVFEAPYWRGKNYVTEGGES